MLFSIDNYPIINQWLVGLIWKIFSCLSLLFLVLCSLWNSSVPNCVLICECANLNREEIERKKKYKNIEVDIVAGCFRCLTLWLTWLWLIWRKGEDFRTMEKPTNQMLLIMLFRVLFSLWVVLERPSSF